MKYNVDGVAAGSRWRRLWFGATRRVSETYKLAFSFPGYLDVAKRETAKKGFISRGGTGLRSRLQWVAETAALVRSVFPGVGLTVSRLVRAEPLGFSRMM